MTIPETTSILIVDDVPENLRLLSAMLEQTGYLVRPATSAKLALRAARQKSPSLILLDMRMPEMGGVEMCQQLKADDALKDIPVIFISALNETEEKIKTIKLKIEKAEISNDVDKLSDKKDKPKEEDGKHES